MHALRILEEKNLQLKKQITCLENEDEKNTNELKDYKALYSHDNYKVLSQRIYTGIVMYKETFKKSEVKNLKLLDELKKLEEENLSLEAQIHIFKTKKRVRTLIRLKSMQSS